MAASADVHRADASPRDLDRDSPCSRTTTGGATTTTKKVEYLPRAADAARSGSYANAAAIDYFERLTPLLPDAERIAPVRQARGDAPRSPVRPAGARRSSARRGRWPSGLGDRGRVARCDRSLAESARRLGRFDEAACASLSAPTMASPPVGDQAGLARRAPGSGTVDAQRWRLSTPRGRSTRRAWRIREEFADDAGDRGADEQPRDRRAAAG